MEPIEMIQLVGYVTSILVCAALATYYLRAFLKRELAASLWEVTGFSLLAFGIFAIAVTALYEFHKILVMLAFAFFAASVASLYYDASFDFFDEKSFFIEKFAVILFVASFVLFLLPLYLFPEEHVARIVESLAMVLFVVAFLVIAVLFNRFAVFVYRRLRAFQPLMWIIVVWSLFIALFWGSVTAVGLVFVLSSLGYILLIWGKRGKPEARDMEPIPL